MWQAAVLLGALLVATQGDAQEQPPPVFHGEAYVVTLEISFQGGWSKRMRGLTSADFQAAVAEEPVAIDASENPQKPGHYLLSINPPLDLRDGKSHRIDLKVREGAKWVPLPKELAWTAIFEKVRQPGL